MTKAVSNKFIEETEFWKTASVAQAGLLTIIASWFARLSFRFLKKKNNKLDDNEKRIAVLEKEMRTIKEAIIYQDDDGKEHPIKDKIREINHAVIGVDLAAANGFDHLQETVKQNKKDLLEEIKQLLKDEDHK